MDISFIINFKILKLMSLYIVYYHLNGFKGKS